MIFSKHRSLKEDSSAVRYLRKRSITDCFFVVFCNKIYEYARSELLFAHLTA